MKLIILGTVPDELLNLKSDLIQAILKKNCDVIASSSSLSAYSKIDVTSLDFIYEPIHLERHGFSLIGNIRTIISLLNLYKKYKPQYILAFGIKLVIWGGISARITNAPFYAYITGLGYAFQGKSLPRKFLTKLVSFLYKIALKKSKAVIFENKDNRDFFVSKKIIPISQTYIINGSGVNMEKYNFTSIPETPISFLLVSRLLGEKGLREYAGAAQIVKKEYPDVEFELVGPEDASLDAISIEEVLGWSDYINYNGGTDDVRPFIKNCHIYVLPSYHEGLPRSSLEAMSMGRPVLTTNAVGCKETVDEGFNGFMVPVGSVRKLADKMIWFIENKDKIQLMGQNSREIVEKRFDVHKVNNEILKILGI